MEHPFLNKADLADKSIEDLQETISGLMTKLSFAYRTQNGALTHQLQMVLETYRNQLKKKMDDLFDKQNLNTKINISSDNEHKS